MKGDILNEKYCKYEVSNFEVFTIMHLKKNNNKNFKINVPNQEKVNEELGNLV